MDTGLCVGWYDVSPSQPSKCLWARGPELWGSLEPSRRLLPPAPFWGAWQVCFITGSLPGRAGWAVSTAPRLSYLEGKPRLGRR